MVDFKRTKQGEATVLRLEYDPNRTAFIALIQYKDGEKSYILAPQRLAVGDTVISAGRADVKPGNTMPLRVMPCLLYTSPSPRDKRQSRMPSSA